MHKKIEELESVLKVIRTWASFDDKKGYQIALIPKDVIKLCDRVLMHNKQIEQMPRGAAHPER